jgi:hypothetical protein
MPTRGASKMYGRLSTAQSSSTTEHDVALVGGDVTRLIHWFLGKNDGHGGVES